MARKKDYSTVSCDGITVSAKGFLEIYCRIITSYQSTFLKTFYTLNSTVTREKGEQAWKLESTDEVCALHKNMICKLYIRFLQITSTKRLHISIIAPLSEHQFHKHIIQQKIDLNHLQKFYLLSKTIRFLSSTSMNKKKKLIWHVIQ